MYLSINHFRIIGMKDLIIPTVMSDWCTYRPFVIQYMAVLPCILSLLMLCVLSMWDGYTVLVLSLRVGGYVIISVPGIA